MWHTSMEDKEKKKKTEFYANLERAYDEADDKNVKIVIESFNAKTDREDILLYTPVIAM